MRFPLPLAAVSAATTLVLGAPLGGSIQGGVVTRRQNGAGGGPPVAAPDGIEGSGASANGIQGSGRSVDATAIEYGLRTRKVTLMTD